MKCFHEQYASAQQTLSISASKLLNNRNASKDEDKTWKQNGHWSKHWNKKKRNTFQNKKVGEGSDLWGRWLEIQTGSPGEKKMVRCNRIEEC